MKKVFIKYNPYRLETEVTVEGNILAENSALLEKTSDGSRLQEWVEDLPQILIDEYNSKEFEITFHGTLLDYEDLVEVLNKAYEDKGLKAELNHIPAKETSDKEMLIEKVFEKIQAGPFDELKNESIINAFEHAKSSDFEVCVVATMSAGKSTLINSLLGKKLMPSKQEACTAIITRIKDFDRNSFKAEVYNKEQRISETYENLTLSIMNRLNSDEDVSEIKVLGDIPFVSSEDVSLVLIDTPGPNNSRDERHKEVQSKLLSKSSKALILYIMTGEFGTDDDNTLLKRVAKSMSVAGKQSKDRFIFVVNKLDGRTKEDGNISDTLDRVHNYLKNHGIVNPNIFPAASLPALDIRMIEGGADIDEDTLDLTEVKIKKLNRNESLHLEKYAILPPSPRAEIEKNLEVIRSDWAGGENENPREALIHTGIPSIEAAIRQYVQKYAKTAKIKNIVDTFMHYLEEVGCIEETKKELLNNLEERERIVKQIESIREKIDGIEEAKKFKKEIDARVEVVNEESEYIVEGVIEKFQALITKQNDNLQNQSLTIDNAEYEVERLKEFLEKLEPDFEEELDDLIGENITATSDALLKAYKEKLASLAEEIDTDGESIRIDPLKLMGGSIHIDDFSIGDKTYIREISDGGEEWVENTDRKWYKPWTWKQEKGYYRKTYVEVEFVSGSALAQTFLRPIQIAIHDNGDIAKEYAKDQSEKIVNLFSEEFKKLDSNLKDKLFDLESYATDKEKADERVKESEKKLKWLDKIKADVESILEI